MTIRKKVGNVSVHDIDAEFVVVDLTRVGTTSKGRQYKFRIRMNKTSLDKFQLAFEILKLSDRTLRTGDGLLHLYVTTHDREEAVRQIMDAGYSVAGPDFSRLASPDEFGIGDESI